MGSIVGSSNESLAKGLEWTQPEESHMASAARSASEFLRSILKQLEGFIVAVGWCCPYRLRLRW